MAVWSEINISTLATGTRLDAEYYQPLNLKRMKDLEKLKIVRLGDIAYVTDGIHASPDVVEDGGVRYLSAKCVKDNDFALGNTLQIRKSQHEANKRTSIRVGDVLLTTVGTIGNAAVVQPDMLPSNMDRHLGLIRLNTGAPVDPYFLSTFLNSEYGRFQSNRESTGNVQLNLFIEKIKELKLPLLEFSQVVSNKTQEAYAKRVESANHYAKAEGLLLSEFGLGDLNLLPTLFYESRFFEIRQAVRLDAEFFQPKYYALIDAILRTGKGRSLGEIVTHCERGLQPQYQDDGEIAVVNTKHMGTQFLSDDFERCSHVAWTKQKKARLKQYDVLFYSTGAYIGRTNCWLSDEKAIGSNHVTIIRPNSECNPVYLALFMNSEAGLMQADCHAHGSAQREVYPNDLRAYTVWLPPMKKQEKLAKMVLDAKADRDESHRLLEEAKRMVEEAVLVSHY